MIIWDFNARVGSRTSEDDQWASVHGLHGMEATNDAGQELLAFKEATVCTVMEVALHWYPEY